MPRRPIGKSEQDKRLRKQAKQKIKSIESSISKTPTKCDVCSAPFNTKNTLSNDIDKWRIAVYDHGPVELVCPDCVPDDIKDSSA